jgi:hypothetical protein
MPLHRLPRALYWLPLAVSCHQGNDAPAQVDLGASSSSSTSPEPPTTSPPTSAAPTTSATESTTGTSTGPGEITPTSGDDSSSSSSGELASSTGDTPSPGCGDAQLGPGEECDPGYPELSNSGACTLSCQLAKCGDSLVQTGKEACDNGPSNNDDLYGGCTSNCQLGPRCNDGKVQGAEECDLGDDNGSGEIPLNGVACDNGCRFEARLFFLSSLTYKGGELGGVEGAHLKCQSLAKQAKLDNPAAFMAWISDAQHSPFQDFEHGPQTAGIPYVRPDGVRVADDWNALVLNGPGEGIIVTEAGDALFAEWVWTGTAPSGKVLDPTAHCQSWTSTSSDDKSRVGRSGIDKVQFPDAWTQWATDRHWTSVATRTCDKDYRLYCVEQ